jgi:translation initiation factor 1 (eIF-1/SUI1)
VGGKEQAVEIQGDHRERIAARLRALGYTVKLVGG